MKPARRSSKTIKRGNAPDPAAPQISKVSKRGKGDPVIIPKNAEKKKKPSLPTKGVDTAENGLAPQISKMSSAQPAQPARQHTVQRDVSNFDARSTDCRIVGKGGASFSTAPANMTEFSQGAPKEQGSFGSRNVSNMPSRNPVSEESQASLQASLEPLLSTPAAAQKSSNANAKFSSKSTSNKI